MLVIIDAKPKDLGLPTDAYVAVEEVHDVSLQSRLQIYNFSSG